MQLVFEQIRAGGDRNFGYLLGDRQTRECALIDPSYSPEAFVERAREQGLTVTLVINTHGHPDHTNGNADGRGTDRRARRRPPALPAGRRTFRSPTDRSSRSARCACGASTCPATHPITSRSTSPPTAC